MDKERHFITTELTDLVTSQVREKKELTFISEDFVSDIVDEMMRLDVKYRNALLEKKEFAFKMAVKKVRNQARKIYGVFQDPKKMDVRKSQLQTLKLDDEGIKNVLETHLSTQERIPYYEHFLDQILALTKHPKRIMDIACGLNPVAFFHYAQQRDVEYVAQELNDEDANQLQSFFENNNLKGHALGFNAVSDFEQIPTEHFDAVFLLKALDTLEHQKRYFTYNLLDHLNADYIVATFPRSSVKGRLNKRGDEIMWFEKILTRKDFAFHRIQFDSETCYICFKDNRSEPAQVESSDSSSDKKDCATPIDFSQLGEHGK